MKKYEERWCHNPKCAMFDRAQTFWYYPATYDSPAEGQDLECSECFGEVHEDMTPIHEVVLDAADWLSSDSWEWDATDLAFYRHAHTYAAHKQEQYRLRLTERSPA